MGTPSLEDERLPDFDTVIGSAVLILSEREKEMAHSVFEAPRNNLDSFSIVNMSPRAASIPTWQQTAPRTWGERSGRLVKSVIDTKPRKLPALTTKTKKQTSPARGTEAPADTKE